MADDLGEGEDERTLELSTVAAIYPELVVDTASDPYSASICVGVEPITPLLIRFPTTDGLPLGGLPTPPDSMNEGTSQSSEKKEGDLIVQGVNSASQDAHRLSHLPPLTLRLSLPEGYPSEQPPVFDLESQFAWLSGAKLEELREAGRTIWEDMGRDQVVFSYIDHLREAADRGFDLVGSEKEMLEVPSDLKVVLLDFDLKAKRAKFEQETFECGICLEPKKGTVCHRLLLCSHVFCVECLQDFYSSSITEGDIGNVKCIAPDCGSEPKVLAATEIGREKKLKEDRTLEPSELLQLPLEQQIVQRYIKLKRKKRLESDRTTVYCPRQWCQGPARCPNKPAAQDDGQDPEGDEDKEPQEYDRNAGHDKLPPPAERLAICEDCTFAFCKVCKASWHGEYFVCFPRSQFELTAEERASEDYMKIHTQPCPTCDARAQKTYGCNHMICFKCDTHFCYLCGAYLDKSNPYEHYNTKKSGCYMRLWELEGGDDGNFGHGFAGGADGIAPDFDSDSDDDDDLPIPIPPVAAVPAGRNNGPVAPVPHAAEDGYPQQGGQGLQRFLQMVQNDEEEEWDSDEMEENDEGWAHLD